MIYYCEDETRFGPSPDTTMLTVTHKIEYHANVGEIYRCGASFALTALSDQLIRILAAIKTLLNCLECEEK